MRIQRLETEERAFVLSPVHPRTRLFVPQEETDGPAPARGSGSAAQMAAGPAMFAVHVSGDLGNTTDSPLPGTVPPFG